MNTSGAVMLVHQVGTAPQRAPGMERNSRTAAEIPVTPIQVNLVGRTTRGSGSGVDQPPDSLEQFLPGDLLCVGQHAAA